MSRLELVLRAILNVCVAVTIGLGLNAWIAIPLFLAGVVTTGELAARSNARDGVEIILLICGGTVTTAILIGLLLNLTPWGLTRVTWAVCWFVVSSAVLVRRRTSGTSIPIDRIRSNFRHHWITGLYGLAALAIFVVAVLIARAGVRIDSQKPLLEFSLVSKSSSSVVVQIHAISTDGAYRITAESASLHARHYSSPPIRVNAGPDGQTLNESVPVNVAGRWEIYLNVISGSSGSRELIIDVG